MNTLTSQNATALPAVAMVWSVTDVVIENPAVLEQQFRDIREAAFDAVAVFVRCSRYTWADAPARLALRRIAERCQQFGLQFWAGFDPRFISRALIGPGSGLVVAAFGDQPRAQTFPHFAPIPQGRDRFSLRNQIVPRHVHTLNEVAIEYYPDGFVRVYAVRAGKAALSEKDIFDLTPCASFFYNARDRYVEAFGKFVPPDDDRWQVMAFFQFRTNFVDFSNRRQMQKYDDKLEQLANDGIPLDLLMWDEPGYTCTYGTLPFSRALRRQYRERCGRGLQPELWKLALDAEDGSHIPVRNGFFRVVQDSLIEAQENAFRTAQRLWGTTVHSGIHDTWHFESADMCDMNHGSLDLWRGLRSKTGGFVDLGGVDQLRETESPYYAHLAALGVIATSLGKLSTGRYTYNNLWTVDDDGGEGWQRGVMSHCAKAMALFANRWLAHCYGPVGTIGEENTFLGSPPLPGYPDHSTWQAFPGWCQLFHRHFQRLQDRLPWANVLVVYPVSTLYALADQRADRVAAAVFRLLLALVDHHYFVDVVSPDLFATGAWHGEQFSCGDAAYDIVLWPHPEIVPENCLPLLASGADRLISIFSAPQRTVGRQDLQPSISTVADNEAELLAVLSARQVSRPVTAPPSTWVSLTETPDGFLVSVMPSRYGYEYAGDVRWGEQTVTLPAGDTLCTILFSQNGTPPKVFFPAEERE